MEGSIDPTILQADFLRHDRDLFADIGGLLFDVLSRFFFIPLGACKLLIEIWRRRFVVLFLSLMGGIPDALRMCAPIMPLERPLSPSHAPSRDSEMLPPPRSGDMSCR